MSLDCTSDGEIEYLDEVLDFSREIGEDEDFMDFSEQMLEENQRDEPSASPGNSHAKTVSTSSTVSQRHREQQRQRKRKHFVPNKATSVSKNDIRRTYAQSYIDGLNSGNIPIFSKSISDMCVPDVVLITRNYSQTGMFLPSVTQTLGCESIVAFYDMFIKSMPDCIFELHSSTIRVFSNNTSCVIFRYTLCGTKVFALNGLEENSNQKVVLSTVDEVSDSFGKLKLNANVTSTVDDPETGNTTEVNTNIRVALGAVYKTKSKCSIFGTTNLHVNPEKKVFRIEFSMSNTNEQGNENSSNAAN